jgi:hypothetical protein
MNELECVRGFRADVPYLTTSSSPKAAPGCSPRSPNLR